MTIWMAANGMQMPSCAAPAAAGILEGDGRNVNATAPVTRQEAMTMFARAMG